MDKQQARINRVTKSLTPEEGRRKIASDERSDYDYPKTEDEWPSIDKLPADTPVGRQAKDAANLDQRIYKERREGRDRYPSQPVQRGDFGKMKERLRVNDKEAGKLQRAAKNRLGSTTRRNR